MGDHAGFVDDDGGAGREVVAVLGWPVEGVFGEELVDGVGVDTGLRREYVGGCSGWGDAELRCGRRRGIVRPLGVRGGGLAGAGGADDEDEVGVTGHCRGGLRLWPGQLDACSVDGVGGGRCRLGSCGARPRRGGVLLGRGCRGVASARSAMDSVSGRPSRRRVVPSGIGAGDVDAALGDGVVGEGVEDVADVVGVDDGVGGDGGGDLAGELGGSPAGLFLGQRLHGLVDHLVDGGHVEVAAPLTAGCSADEPLGGVAELFGALGPVAVKPSCGDVVVFGWAAVDDGFAFEAPSVPAGWGLGRRCR